MKALIIGLVVIAAAVIACIPAGLGWWDEVLAFLRGGLPVLAAFIGLIAVFIGIMDIKDRITVGKEKNDAKDNA
jgi:heme A synthase